VNDAISLHSSQGSPSAAQRYRVQRRAERDGMRRPVSRRSRKIRCKESGLEAQERKQAMAKRSTGALAHKLARIVWSASNYGSMPSSSSSTPRGPTKPSG
jgi:hypothetical protein